MTKLFTLCFALLLTSCLTVEESPHIQTEDISRAASELPPPITREESEKVVIDLLTEEVVAELAPGVTYEYWTYNGTVPGPFLRVREGDDVEIRLTHSAEGHEYSAIPHTISVNAFPFAEAKEEHGEEDAHQDVDTGEPEQGDPHAADSGDEHGKAGHAKHSIDLHAAIGPGGGAPLTQTETGKTSIFSFKATRPGIYVYHCASPHIPTHIANGMYGLILVEPKGGLSPVDQEFAVVQGEFYTAGMLGEKGHQVFSKEKLLEENPEYFVFNGRTGALTGERALRAKAGEKIRLYFGVGSHIASNVHLIGGIFDRVFREGAILSVPALNVQTTIVPPGGAMMAEFTIDVPGTYLLVDHSLTRAIDRGAIAELIIEGEERPDLFRAVNPDPNHTHADFAVYIEGVKLDLSDPKYMSEKVGENDHEEDGHEHTTLHLHGGEDHVIHRHKPGQTLGEFFSSIGFTLTAECFTRDSGEEYCNGGGKSWQMFVNGKEQDVDPDYPFADEDHILLSFGATESDAEKQLQTLTDDACLYSRTCPERGEPPPENCVADPTVPCTAPLE